MSELRVARREARVPNRDATHRRHATRMLATRDARRATPLGVTLVELLVTITIISILSAAFLGTSQLAMESSREARTKSTIGKIHGLLMEKWNEYNTRRVDIDTSAYYGDPNRRQFGELSAWARLDATRKLMQLEMPDRWSDILGTTVTIRNPDPSNQTPPNILLTREFSAGRGYRNMQLAYPAITRTYLRRYNTLVGSAATIEENQGAECLYMIIMLTTGDGEARTLFSEHDIGDTDGDGAPEFLDGWRRPIHFIRWPAGFGESGRSALISADAQADHDPFDHFRSENPPPAPSPADNRGYRLVPLVYSNGPDGEADLFTSPQEIVYPNRSLFPSAAYRQYPEGAPDSKLGAPYDVNADSDDNSLDNIHNHLQDNR